MLNEVISKLQENGYRVIEYRNEQNEIFNFVYIKDKVIFLCSIMDSIKDIDEYCDKIRDFIVSDFDTFRNQLSQDDILQPDFNYYGKFPSIKAFLWDIYIIGVTEDGVGTISDEEQFMVQRDTYIAKKIIVDSTDIEIVLSRIEEIINPEKKLDELLSDSIDIFSEKKIINYLLKGDGLDTSDTHANDKIDHNWDSISDIIGYFNEFKAEKIDKN